MEFSIKFNTVESRWFTVYIEGSKNIMFHSLKVVFALANRADPDEMPHNAAFYLGLRCLPKYPLRGFWSS